MTAFPGISFRMNGGAAFSQWRASRKQPTEHIYDAATTRQRRHSARLSEVRSPDQFTQSWRTAGCFGNLGTILSAMSILAARLKGCFRITNVCSDPLSLGLRFANDLANGVLSLTC